MKSRPWLPYVAPFGIYMAFLLVQSPENLLWMYPVKTIVVAGALWFFRKHYEELRLNFSLLALLVGLAVIVIWIAIDPFYPKLAELMWRFERFLNALSGQPPPSFPPPLLDPTSIQPVTLQWTFIAFRVAGAVVVVPVMEELFWRAFMIRWLVDEDFKKVPVGTFTWSSFAFTVALFGAEHNEWVAGLICGALYNWLYYRRKDVFSCVVAHAVSNAALAAWVLARGDWKFW